MKKWLCFVGVLCGCTGPSKKIPQTVEVLQTKTPAALVFPLGKYRHDVSVHVFKDEEGKAKDYGFSGLAETSKETIRLVALSPLGTTVMKINEDRATGQIEIEIFLDRLKKSEDKIRVLYGLLRKVLLWEKEPAQQTVKMADISEGPMKAKVEFGEIQDGIPNDVKVVSERFEIRIRVKSVQ